MFSMRAVVVCVVVAVVSASERGPYPARPLGKDDYRLIQYTDIKTDTTSFGWVSPDLIDDMSWRSEDWTDITDFYRNPVSNRRAPLDIPSKPSQQTTVRRLLPSLSQNFTRDRLEHLQSYNNRYYSSPTGLESALWIRDEMEKIARAAGRDDVKVDLFEHSWAQPSVIATIAGTELPDEVVVIGGHIDSTGPGMPNGRAPGADDDGSGFVSAFDVYRVLVENGYKPRRTIQFMGYAAEEVGLRGSQAIATDYARRNVNVIAVFQSEMNGYVGDTRQIMIATPTDRDVDYDLSIFARELVDEYCSIGWYSLSVFGASDHASWTNRNFRAMCVAEGGPASRDLNPCYHKACDLLNILDVSYIIEFNKLALAFAVEIADF